MSLSNDEKREIILNYFLNHQRIWLSRKEMSKELGFPVRKDIYKYVDRRVLLVEDEELEGEDAVMCLGENHALPMDEEFSFTK
jgi:hypothetical protein